MTAKEFSKTMGESTMDIVFLIILTGTMYIFIWIADRRRKLNELSNYELISLNVLIAPLICYGISAYLHSSLQGVDNDYYLYDIIDTIAILLPYVSLIFIIFIAWKIGNWFELYCAEEFKIDIKVSKFLLIILNVVYLNYLFNTLGNYAVKQNLLKS